MTKLLGKQKQRDKERKKERKKEGRQREREREGERGRKKASKQERKKERKNVDKVPADSSMHLAGHKTSPVHGYAIPNRWLGLTGYGAAHVTDMRAGYVGCENQFSFCAFQTRWLSNQLRLKGTPNSPCVTYVL